MRVLVLTHNFKDFTGSEIIALEVAEWFRNQGDSVTVGANYVGGPLRGHLPREVALSDRPERLPVAEFDIVWCQHNMLAQFSAASLRRLARHVRPPLVVLVSLSPYEPYERIVGSLQRAVSAEVMVNSPETGRAVRAQFARKGDPPPDMQVFHNAAPDVFWTTGDAAPGRARGSLRSLTVVSNHPPDELMKALAMLRRRSIAVRLIGSAGDCRRVLPRDIAETDAVISIGKTVPYALAAGTPVFIYDHFGGDGWLTRANYARSLDRNFSGRPSCRRLSGDALVRELVGGFHQGFEELAQLRATVHRRALTLDSHLRALRARADTGQAVNGMAATTAATRLRLGFALSPVRARVLKRRYRAAMRTIVGP